MRHILVARLLQCSMFKKSVRLVESRQFRYNFECLLQQERLYYTVEDYLSDDTM